MIGRLNHVAIAVPEGRLRSAAYKYRATLGASISPEVQQWDHGVTTVFVQLGNTNIELIEPLGENSPIRGFFDKHPDGGLHHVCYEVADIKDAIERMKAKGARVIGDGTPKIGAHGKFVVFLHPKDFDGTLIELEEV